MLIFEHLLLRQPETLKQLHDRFQFSIRWYLQLPDGGSLDVEELNPEQNQVNRLMRQAPGRDQCD